VPLARLIFIGALVWISSSCARDEASLDKRNNDERSRLNKDDSVIGAYDELKIQLAPRAPRTPSSDVVGEEHLGDVSTPEEAEARYLVETQRVTGRRFRVSSSSPHARGWLVTGYLLIGDGSMTYGDVPAVVHRDGSVVLHGIQDTRDMPTIPNRDSQ
jgi:hypothetical protein